MKEKDKEAIETPIVFLGISDPPALAFEILVSSTATEWPESCAGVKPVLSAVQKMLQAAAAGNATAFIEANYEAEEAMEKWGAELFGGPEEKP